MVTGMLVQLSKGTELRRVCCWIALLFILSNPTMHIFSQVRQTPTPITANLFTPTPFNFQQFAPTVTATFTLTPPGPASLEARESAGNVNVRAAPDINSERLGTIAFGTQYPALRRYFQWYELGYDRSPNGSAWVYSELVEITGDVGQIQVIETLEELNSASAAGFEEARADIETAAGAEETATANARILNAPTAAASLERINEAAVVTALPTFTYPPNLLALASTPATLPNSEQAGNADLPPLFPIIMLGGFGIVGLLVYSIRR